MPENIKPAQPLRLFDMTMIVVSFVIGMGIFRTPVEVAQQAGSPAIFFIAWVVGGLIALCGALTYAEIGSRYPVMGGYYKIFSKCYHPSLAFAINAIIIISNAASVAAVALIGAEYIGNVAFDPSSDLRNTKIWIAAICIVIFYIINLLGLRMSATTQNILMLFKIGLVLMMISAIFVAPDANAEIANSLRPTGDMSWADIGKTFGICLIAVSFTYGGIQHSINFGAEVKNAHRLMPRAISFAILIILVLYMATNYAYYRVIGFETLAESESIAAIMASKIFGDGGFKIVSWLFFFSILGYVNVMLMTNPRVTYAMSEEGTLPKIFQQKNKKTGVMVFGLTAFTILSIFTLFYAGTFSKILDYIVFLDSIGMAFSAATIFILRYRKVMVDPEKTYKTPFYPLLPILYILAYIFIALSIFAKEPKAAWIGLAILGGFLVIYFVVQALKKK